MYAAFVDSADLNFSQKELLRYIFINEARFANGPITLYASSIGDKSIA
jgi:hypothetical protein